MTTYRFRLRFYLSSPGIWDLPANSVHQTIAPELIVVLQTITGEPLKDSREWVVLGKGFRTEEEARRTGAKVRDALLLSSARLRLGIDIGEDRATFSSAQAVKDLMLREHGTRYLDDIHGLMVYPEDLPVAIPRMRGTATVTRPDSQEFETSLRSAYAAHAVLTPQVRLALELYSASHFEASARARFLALMMAIEAVLQPEEWIEPDDDSLVSTSAHVARLIEQTRAANLLEIDRKSLLSSLEWLRRESISRTGRRLLQKHLPVSEYLSKGSSEFFAYCYGVRSKLLHTGTTGDPRLHLGTVVGELSRMVSDLLTAMALARTKREVGPTE
jgi:hypothetical protein